MRQRERNALKFERNQSKGGVAKPIPRKKNDFFICHLNFFEKQIALQSFHDTFLCPLHFWGTFSARYTKSVATPGLKDYIFINL